MSAQTAAMTSTGDGESGDTLSPLPPNSYPSPSADLMTANQMIGALTAQLAQRDKALSELLRRLQQLEPSSAENRSVLRSELGDRFGRQIDGNPNPDQQRINDLQAELDAIRESRSFRYALVLSRFRGIARRNTRPPR